MFYIILSWFLTLNNLLYLNLQFSKFSHNIYSLNAKTFFFLITLNIYSNNFSLLSLNVGHLN